MEQMPKTPLIRIGDFFFKWRDKAFPLILILALLFFAPATTLFGSTSLDTTRDWLAIAVIILGLVVRFSTIGWAYIVRGGVNKEVYADKLVVSGYFGMCRNPLYVGNLLIAVGIWLLHGHWVVMLGGTGLFLLIYISIVAAEEHFLRAKFGADFDSYCASVSRWIPNLSRHSEVTKGMQFSFLRSLVNDYGTIATALLTIVVLQLVETYRSSSSDVFSDKLLQMALPTALIIAFGVSVKMYKLRLKRKA